MYQCILAITLVSLCYLIRDFVFFCIYQLWIPLRSCIHYGILHAHIKLTICSSLGKTNKKKSDFSSHLLSNYEDSIFLCMLIGIFWWIVLSTLFQFSISLGWRYIEKAKAQKAILWSMCVNGNNVNICGWYTKLTL